jgi:hypothetical protein
MGHKHEPSARSDTRRWQTATAVGACPEMLFRVGRVGYLYLQTSTSAIAAALASFCVARFFARSTCFAFVDRWAVPLHSFFFISNGSPIFVSAGGAQANGS